MKVGQLKREREMEIELEKLRQTYNSGKTKDALWRRKQLKGLLSLLEEREHDIFKALEEDLGKHHVESYRDEIGPLLKSVNYALDNLSKWMSSKRAQLPLVAFPSRAELVPEPLGLILIISSWNFPIGLSLEPLIGAIAAGNAVVIKPSEVAPKCSSLLANAMDTYLDKTAVKVVQGDMTVGEQLLQHKWAKILFTGSPRVGSMVMAAAAKHLTPVILELGGKCPAVIDSSISTSWGRQTAMKRIISAKFAACSGQACIAIDYVIVDNKFASTFVEIMKDWLKKMFGEKPMESDSLAKIVNNKHFSRLKSLLLDDPMVKACIVHGGSFDEDKMTIEPTILLDPPLTSTIMTEEIFGPLLPIITVDKIEESVQFLKSRPKPLALYVFTNNETLKRRILSETSSGSVVFNDAMVQYLPDTLPFGGVGESGFGRYHGKFSFDAFSHEKAVVARSFIIDFWFRYPPWSDYKFQLLKSAYQFHYLSVLLIAVGLKKKY